MEINFKFAVGDFVKYVLNPEIRFYVSERLYQECYSGCGQNHYRVRQVVEKDFSTPAGLSRELLSLTEPELVSVGPEEIEELKKTRDKFKR